MSATPPTADAPVFPFELIREDLQVVEIAIRDQAKAFDPAVEGYVSYVCQAAGKRIRPALALMAGGATGGKNDQHTRLSVILEMIHIASLVHDDIMDGAATRRGLPTAAAKWGHSLSVLLGDALFAYALELATGFEDTEVCRQIAKASRDVCSGEILQTQRRFDLNLSVPDYLRMIEMKTAALFAVAAGLGARLNGVPENVEKSLHSFGMKLGTVYQIYDDCLDLVGDEKTAGKTLRTDLIKGKLTLPILYLLMEATDAQKQKLNRMLLQGEPMDTSILAGIADYEGAIERAVKFAQDMLNDAEAELICLGDSPYKTAFQGVAAYLRGLLSGCVLNLR
ncbi:polyprenyl synthetase family protein [Brevifollis gellanilyticus]|uniref:Heptaprenyl diphosphate synthase subunit II n=1 Tax=Brevifollis gellanilyticus TaxID=748831 RepID=A0A512M957_9BACT|nr:polyprenyl synthetase family protein [Brevifollis gellanilyticus]GEP43270.1 heptaprenyl diphosphate synthase subunit II [Brevifollis gellanilyticus]